MLKNVTKFLFALQLRFFQNPSALFAFFSSSQLIFLAAFRFNLFLSLRCCDVDFVYRHRRQHMTIALSGDIRCRFRMYLAEKKCPSGILPYFFGHPKFFPQVSERFRDRKWDKNRRRREALKRRGSAFRPER
jgi:hypothetical protein